MYQGTLLAGLTLAAAAQGSLAVTPSILETTARTGATTSTTLTNTTGKPLKVTVRARPWKQARDGAVAANRSRRLSGVALSASRFRLASGASRTVHVTMGRVPSGRSLYGALDVVGKPTRKRKGINVAYRLVPSVRFKPTAAARRFGLRAGSARVTGSGSSRALELLVRNAGNTVDPVTGSVSISGAGGGRSGSTRSVSILPGSLVAVRVASLSGLRRGSYTARIRLAQAGTERLSVSKRFRIRR